MFHCTFLEAMKEVLLHLPATLCCSTDFLFYQKLQVHNGVQAFIRNNLEETVLHAT